MTHSIAPARSPRHDIAEFRDVAAAGANTPVESAPYGIDPADLLDVVASRSWSAMTPDQQLAYRWTSKPYTQAQLDEWARIELAELDAETISEDAVRDLLDVALRFPELANREGLSRLAAVWCETDAAVALAERLDAPPATAASDSQLRVAEPLAPCCQLARERHARGGVPSLATMRGERPRPLRLAR